jgi:hypothetical protein
VIGAKHGEDQPEQPTDSIRLAHQGFSSIFQWLGEA